VACRKLELCTPRCCDCAFFHMLVTRRSAH
jgi:hypothetical protein